MYAVRDAGHCMGARSRSRSVFSFSRITVSEKTVSAFHFSGSERAASRTRRSPNFRPTAPTKIALSRNHEGHSSNVCAAESSSAPQWRHEGDRARPILKSAEAPMTCYDLGGSESKATVPSAHPIRQIRHKGVPHPRWVFEPALPFLNCPGLFFHVESLPSSLHQHRGFSDAPDPKVDPSVAPREDIRGSGSRQYRSGDMRHSSIGADDAQRNAAHKATDLHTQTPISREGVRPDGGPIYQDRANDENI